ncbi:MAG: DUF1553 domain-containing protein [Planctomycetaceae bacterium]|nr:DUF1553 domain-containing protein [Planctomycetaceae bacterium]
MNGNLSKFIAGWLLLISWGSVQNLPGEDAGPLNVYPPAPVLHGGRSSLQLVVDRQVGKLQKDVSEETTFRAMTPELLDVSERGNVTPIKTGEGIVEVVHEGVREEVSIRIENIIENKPWSFRDDVQVVLTKTGCNMGACHGAQSGKKGFKLSLRGYDSASDYLTMTHQARGRRVMLHDPARSLLLLKATGTIAHGGGSRFETDSHEYKIVSEWIAEGAMGPLDGDRLIESLDVYPKQIALEPTGKQQMSVIATYSDGSQRDVTRWSIFNSTEAGVATVDENGLVKVSGLGESAITVWYNSRVTAATISVPSATSVSPEVYTQSPRSNFIDDLILSKLERLQIPPSTTAGDSDFLRRAYLDTIGVLPTVEETKAFLEDQGTDKRQRLIESLLTRPEYVDYWSYQWSDLLLLSSNRLKPSAVWSFYRWIRTQVEANRPWDQFAREIVTASGSTLENGATNFFVLHKDPQDLTESMSVTFLGMSIGCARCHDHPLERWTLDDYYGLANLFGRVQQKNTEVVGEAVVYAAAQGEVKHPTKPSPAPPRPLDGTALSFDDTHDRREHLANWLTAGENPYFARAIVNRVWANYMGRGLVEPVDDLRLTNPASNPELLDALAKDLIAHQYDIKHLIRTIMSSAAYQRSSEVLPGNAADDRFYSHYLPKRMSAEVLLDALSQVTGSPTKFEGFPAGWRSMQLPDSNVSSYFLSSFGRPAREFPCACERTEDPSVTQSLHLSNGDTLNKKLEGTEGKIATAISGKQSSEQIVEELYLAALCRFPTDEEKRQILEVVPAYSDLATDEEKKERRGAIEDTFWSVLTSRRFLFVH